MNAGEVEPGFRACEGCLEVLGQASVAVEPSQRALDDRSARQDFEAFCGLGSLDDFKGLLTQPLERIFEFLAGVGAVREEVA